MSEDKPKADVERMRAMAELLAAEWDVKYRRIVRGGFVGLGPAYSCFDDAEEVRKVLLGRDHRSGRFEVVCADLPSPEDAEDAEDGYFTDEQYEAFDRAMKDIGLDDVMWVVPEGDDRYDPEFLGLYLTD